MEKSNVHERYLVALLRGDRKSARAVIEEILQTGTPATNVYTDIIWPIMVKIEELLRAERISIIQEHLATRINRTIVDQLQNKLPRRPARNKKIVVCCAQDELQELGAQMIADMFESDGWEVKFLGGGINNDDILAYINEQSPNILLIYGTTPKQTPNIRQLIDTIKRVNAWPNMRIMLSGGIFNRAEGLWEEIGADLFAATAVDAILAAVTEKSTESYEARGTTRRRRKRQKLLQSQLAE
jgi:methanogenic corrinoid protein MtbC1